MPHIWSQLKLTAFFFVWTPVNDTVTRGYYNKACQWDQKVNDRFVFEVRSMGLHPKSTRKPRKLSKWPLFWSLVNQRLRKYLKRVNWELTAWSTFKVKLEIKKSSKQTRDGVLKSESQSTDLHSKSTRDQHRFFEVQSMEFNNKEIRYYIQRQVPWPLFWSLVEIKGFNKS